MSDIKPTSTPKHDRDPLGLAGLPGIEPAHDDWAAIRAALESSPADAPDVGTRRARPWQWAGGLAMAASMVLAAILVISHVPGPDQPGPVTEPVLNAQAANIDELIAMSQVLEKRLRRARSGTGALPARSLVWVSELEDMIARVDGELSIAPESPVLWGQRVNLLLDLESIYLHQFERELGRMASL